MDYHKKYYEKNKMEILQKRKEYCKTDKYKDYQKSFQSKKKMSLIQDFENQKIESKKHLIFVLLSLKLSYV